MTTLKTQPVIFLELIRKKAQKKILFLPHAVQQMNRSDRMITTAEIGQVIFRGEIIEDYPADARGHSCLVVGSTSLNRVIHVVCAPKDEFLAIITSYVPNKEKWTDGYKIRRKK